jgi:RNA polymerase sigma-70 factor (ECF subfamily)
VVLETFLRAFRHLSRFDLGASFSVWLHRIAVNCSIGFLRKRACRIESGDPRRQMNDDALVSVASESPGPDCAVLNTEISQRLHTALDVLSPRERAAFVLRHFENRSIAEICLAMHLRESAAKQCIFRAVQKLRQELASILTATS